MLKPGGVSGTRYMGSAALPLWLAMSPASTLLKNIPVDAVAKLVRSGEGRRWGNERFG